MKSFPAFWDIKLAFDQLLVTSISKMWIELTQTHKVMKLQCKLVNCTIWSSVLLNVLLAVVNMSRYNNSMQNCYIPYLKTLSYSKIKKRVENGTYTNTFNTCRIKGIYFSV